MEYRVVQPWPRSKRARESLAQVGSVMMPARFSMQVSDPDGVRPAVELFFEVRNGVPQCRGVHIDSTEDGADVRCSGLAGVRIEDLLEQAIQGLVSYKVLSDGSTGFHPLNTSELSSDPKRPVREARDARRKTKLNNELLQEVARVYRANINDKPTQAVAEHFNKQPRTARMYVHEARDKGFLGKPIPGRAGEQ